MFTEMFTPQQPGQAPRQARQTTAHLVVAVGYQHPAARAAQPLRVGELALVAPFDPDLEEQVVLDGVGAAVGGAVGARAGGTLGALLFDRRRAGDLGRAADGVCLLPACHALHLQISQRSVSSAYTCRAVVLVVMWRWGSSKSFDSRALTDLTLLLSGDPQAVDGVRLSQPLPSYTLHLQISTLPVS